MQPCAWVVQQARKIGLTLGPVRVQWRRYRPFEQVAFRSSDPPSEKADAISRPSDLGGAETLLLPFSGVDPSASRCYLLEWSVTSRYHDPHVWIKAGRGIF